MHERWGERLSCITPGRHLLSSPDHPPTGLLFLAADFSCNRAAACDILGVDAPVRPSEREHEANPLIGD